MFELNGLTDYQKKIDYVTANFPNESEELLRKMGNKFRAKVKSRSQSLKGRKINRASLSRSYHLSKVEKYGKAYSIDFWSTSPHFHLIERGHRVVTGGKLNKKDGGQSAKGKGKYTGVKVDGREMVFKTYEEFEGKVPEDVERMINRIVRKLL